MRRIIQTRALFSQSSHVLTGVSLDSPRTAVLQQHITTDDSTSETLRAGKPKALQRVQSSETQSEGSDLFLDLGTCAGLEVSDPAAQSE
ncbi:hypothetical protein MHYP_G00203640 [Metynnis hypsauchen]